MSVRYKAPDSMWHNQGGNNSEQIFSQGGSESLYSESLRDEKANCVKGSTFIGEYMFELWKNQCLCDVRLQVEDKSFLAHKIVLAAFSEVFCPSQPRIRPTVCIEVPNTTPDAVYQILMYLYTSEMHLTDCNLEPVLNAACFMGISDIVDMIRAILDRPTVENCGLYMDIRKRQGMAASLLEFPKLCTEHFSELVDSRVFLCMTFEELEKLLQNPNLLVTSEMDTVRGVIAWLEFNPLGRTQHTGRLLELINLECVDTADLVKLKEEKQHLFHDANSSEVIMDALIKRAKACSDQQHPRNGSFYENGNANNTKWSEDTHTACKGGANVSNNRTPSRKSSRGTTDSNEVFQKPQGEKYDIDCSTGGHRNYVSRTSPPKSRKASTIKRSEQNHVPDNSTDNTCMSYSNLPRKSREINSRRTNQQPSADGKASKKKKPVKPTSNIQDLCDGVEMYRNHCKYLSTMKSACAASHRIKGLHAVCGEAITCDIHPTDGTDGVVQQDLCKHDDTPCLCDLSLKDSPPSMDDTRWRPTQSLDQFVCCKCKSASTDHGLTCDCMDIVPPMEAPAR